jgi:hypothetical protein
VEFTAKFYVEINDKGTKNENSTVADYKCTSLLV